MDAYQTPEGFKSSPTPVLNLAHQTQVLRLDHLNVRLLVSCSFGD